MVTFVYDPANRLTPSIDGATGGITTYQYSATGNLTTITEPAGGSGVTTMAYDKENRLFLYSTAGSVGATYTYNGDGQKRTEQAGGVLTTLVWDDQDYLQGRA